MLLETKSIIQFALLWGSTWVVASLAIASVLVMAMAATWTVSRVEVKRPWLVGAVLLALLGVSYAAADRAPRVRQPGCRIVRLRAADVQPDLLRGPAVRIEPEARARRLRAHYGANLLGAMVGGVAEYLSLVTGYRVPAAGDRRLPTCWRCSPARRWADARRA